MTALATVVLVAAAIAAGLGGVRWLRVAQREHYLPGAATRFARRWWTSDPFDIVLGAVAIGAAVASGFVAATGLASAAAVAIGPRHLSFRGRTSQLVWTRRLRTVAGLALGELVAAGVVARVVAGLRVAAVVVVVEALTVPVIVDLALLGDTPIEVLVARRYVRRASERLARVAPIVVAITGSYGKTSTKHFVAHLVSGTRVVVASPRSYNNRIGLARAINENLAAGTEVFVAEMGAYGPGEIARLTRWLRPRLAAITAIGPVHLERFGSLERTLAAKAEIFEGVETAVLNVDGPRLAELAGRLLAEGRRVRRISGETKAADVAIVGRDTVAEFFFVDGALVGAVAVDATRPFALSNAACAAAIALELGVPPDVVSERLASLPVVEHRLAIAHAPSGVVVLDDTFNSNPAGAGLALAALSASGGGRRVVVTPGMVELGPVQDEENAAFARAVTASGAELVVVGRTNRRALLAGGGESDGRGPRTFAIREEAVAWVRAELGPGDAVLYENDLPDHFP